MASKFALVIANTEYQDASFAKLTAPGKDAEEFARVLRASELAAFNEVQVLLNEGESKIRRSIARFFADRKRDDLLLLYFSGHGIRNGQGQLFLATIDTEINLLEATGIPSEFVTYAMNNSRSQRQLLILDCCNSGAFAYGSKSPAGVGKSMGIGSAFEGSGFGHVVLTATDATQYAWEGDKVIGNTQQSVFTHFLIEGLIGEADRNNDGRIDVDELYDYAYEQVVHRTPKQTPGKWSYKQQGDIVLRDNVKPRDGKAASLPSDLLEILSHPNSTVRRAAIQDLISLLNGKHLGLAHAAQDSLRQIAESDDSLSLRRIAGNALIAHGIKTEPTAPVEVQGEYIKDEENIKKPSGFEQTRINTPPQLPALTKTLPIKAGSNLRLIGGIAGGLLITGLLIWGGSKLLQNLPAATPESTSPSQANMMFTSLSSPPTLTQVSASPTSGLGIGSTMISEKDGMIILYVPSGEFIMGSNETDAGFEEDEKPAHFVYVNAFWIDKTEVTNKLYSVCVDTGVCQAPSNIKSSTHGSYYRNSDYDNYPVVYVTWDMAKTYCEWAGRRLPTEAEWEKAARGPSAYDYPWGDDFNGTIVNFCDTNCSHGHASDLFSDGYEDVSPVGSYPAGKSLYSALDMAGNVWEWVDGWYDVYPGGNPNASPDFGEGKRILRGGAYYSRDYNVRSADRFVDYPPDPQDSFGFRCAMSAAP